MAKMSNRGPTKRFLISEMDRSVKRMLKLIEEEGDSFAKKAEIYIQKRPELISQVENFYRMFRSLAERYDDATYELQRALPPTDHRSQPCSMTEICSEPPSAITSPEHRLTRRLSGTHAVFLDVNYGNKGGYETSTYDSGSDHDDSFYNNNNNNNNNYNNSNCSYSGSSNYGNYRRLRRKITELENELRKIQIEQEVNKSSQEIADYEEELRVAKERIRVSEEEISELKAKLGHYEMLHEDRIKKEEEGDEDGMDEGMGDEVERLRVERDEYAMKLSDMEEEMRVKDDQIEELNERLEKLKVECGKSSRAVEELEEMVRKQREMIEEGAEEKVQSERQLCVSLEHYRNAYQMLRKGLLEQKNAVMAS